MKIFYFIFLLSFNSFSMDIEINNEILWEDLAKTPRLRKIDKKLSKLNFSHAEKYLQATEFTKSDIYQLYHDINYLISYVFYLNKIYNDELFKLAKQCENIKNVLCVEKILDNYEDSNYEFKICQYKTPNDISNNLDSLKKSSLYEIPSNALVKTYFCELTSVDAISISLFNRNKFVSLVTEKIILTLENDTDNKQSIFEAMASLSDYFSQLAQIVIDLDKAYFKAYKQVKNLYEVCEKTLVQLKEENINLKKKNFLLKKISDTTMLSLKQEQEKSSCLMKANDMIKCHEDETILKNDRLEQKIKNLKEELKRVNLSLKQTSENLSEKNQKNLSLEQELSKQQKLYVSLQEEIKRLKIKNEKKTNNNNNLQNNKKKTLIIKFSI